MNEPAAPLRILVVDDEADHRLLLKMLLERDGRAESVAEAGDGQQAIAEAERTQPDLAILDLDMPVMTGLEALPQIRRVSPDTRVVVLSGLPRDEWAESVIAGGAVGYLQKDVFPLRLVDDLLELAGVLRGVQDAIAKSTQRWEPRPEIPGRARRFVADVLARADATDLAEIVTLLVSELVTNAVVHAGTALEIAVELLPRVVRVNVFDRSPDSPVPRQPEPDETTGRGLMLLDALATSWGVDQFPSGKTVWFEIARHTA